MAPDSRRSDITGFLSVRCSTLRLSCDSAITGTCQLLGERLERARDLGNLGGAILLRAGHLHQLQVVEHDQVETVLALQATRARAHVGRRQCAGVVDVDLARSSSARSRC